MTPAERLISRELQAMADIKVSQRDIERAHDELRARLALAPSHPLRTRLPIVAAAVALAVAAVAIWVGGAPLRQHEPAHRPAHPSDVAAIRAATGFVDAFAGFDVPRARGWLTRGATTTGALAENWAALNRFFAATGGQIILQPCRVLARAADGTHVTCRFRYQLLGSAELGRGPYGGSLFDITTRHGRVSGAFMYFEYRNGFSAQMWSPMATWMNRTHPHDAAVMYTDWPQDTEWQLTGPSIRLWSQRTHDFVRFIERACSSARTPGLGLGPAACTGFRPGTQPGAQPGAATRG